MISDSHSIWQKIDKPFSPPLATDLSAEICVIGAGIAGLSVAYQLARQGKEVVVLDRERFGVNQTGLTTAHLSNALDEGYLKLQRLHGIEGARLAAESHTEAISEIERIIKLEEIDCDFQRLDGFLFLSPEHNRDFLEAEIKAAHDAGLHQVEFVPNAPTDLFNSGLSLRYPNQAQFHPLKYLLGLATAVQRRGGRIFSHSAVHEIQEGYPARVITAQGFQVVADQVVVATNSPFNHKILLQTKMAAYRSYALAVRVPKLSTAPQLFWDTENPYHYIRFYRDSEHVEDLMIVGGEDHRTGQEVHPEERFDRLQNWILNRLHLPSKVVAKWSGQILEPADGLALIGKSPGDHENILVATGDSGHGMTHGTLAGMILKDLILENENPWQDLYDPSRLTWRGLGTMFREVTQSTLPYSDWLSPGDVDSVDQIPPGEGAILREGLRKIAIYRDHQGQLHPLSATCPHLGGLVRWNAAEKTWDCPCHGSRFEKTGEVKNGPATQGLHETDDPTVGHELPAAFGN